MFQRNVRSTCDISTFLQKFVAYILSSLGGTMITALIMGQPIGWLTNDWVFGTYAFVFALAFNPLTGGLFRAIVNAPILSTLISVMDDLSWGNSISTLGVQRILQPWHANSPIKTSVSAAIVSGITSGCGGGVIRSMLNFNNASWFLSTPRHLSAPHWPIQLTATLSVLYYFLVNPHGYLPYAGVTINEGKWALIVICILTNSVWNLLGVSQLLSYGATQANEQVVLKRAAVAPARRESNGASSTTLRQPIVQSNEEPEDVSAGDSPAPRSRKSTTRSSRSSSRKKA